MVIDWPIMDPMTADLMQFCDDMLRLKTTCLRPTSNEPYIVASSGGIDNSPEGAQVCRPERRPKRLCLLVSKGGFTHGFVVEFASKEDRDYYVSADPVHQAFVKKNGSRFEDVRVIDYEKGVY